MATSIRDVQWNMPYRQVVPSYQAQQKQLNAAGWGSVNSDMSTQGWFNTSALPAVPNIPAPVAVAPKLSPLTLQSIAGSRVPLVEAPTASVMPQNTPNVANPMAAFNSLSNEQISKGLADNASDYGAAIGINNNTTNPGMSASMMEAWGKYGKPLIGTAQEPGPLSAALGIGQGLFNVGLGLKSYNLAKDNLNFQKEAFAKNYGAQKESLIEDRGWQAARQAAREGKDYNAAKSAAMADWGKRLA